MKKEVNLSLCPCCDCDSWDFVFERREPALFFEGGEYMTRYHCCKRCGYAYKSPIPDRLDDYYREAWQNPPRGHDETSTWLVESLMCHGVSRIESCLDVGSREDGLLSRLADVVPVAFKSSIDPSRGDGFVGTGESIPNAYRGHDLVCSTHVMEHAEDVGLFFRDLVDLSSNLVFVEVPSVELEAMESVSVMDDLNRIHLHHFTISSLVELGRKHGLLVLRADHVVGEKMFHNRALFKKAPVHGRHMLTRVNDHMLSLYERAGQAIAEYPPSEYALYGKSDAYYKFLEVWPWMKEYRVFDKYRGTLDGIEDVRGVIITPRQLQSRKAIREFLEELGVSWIDPWD